MAEEERLDKKERQAKSILKRHYKPKPSCKRTNRLHLCAAVTCLAPEPGSRVDQSVDPRTTMDPAVRIHGQCW